MALYQEIYNENNTLVGIRRTTDGTTFDHIDEAWALRQAYQAGTITKEVYISERSKYNDTFNQYMDWLDEGNMPDPDPNATLVKFKERALSIIRSMTGHQINIVGDWGMERQSNARDGIFPNVVRPSDGVVFSHHAECVAWRASMLDQGDTYENAIDLAPDIPAVLSISETATYDTTGLLSYTQVKEQKNG